MNSLSNHLAGPLRLRWAAVLVALSACLLRVWMCDYPILSTHRYQGFSGFRHPDEPIIAHLTRRAVETGRVSANWDGFPQQLWSRPTYQFSPYTLIHSALAIGVHAVADWPATLPEHVRLSRWLSALWGGLAVLLVFFAARELFDEWVALLAQTILAVALLHVQDSIYARVDAFVSFLTVLCLLFAAKALREPRPRYRICLALAVGVAIAAKYNAIGLLCFVAFVELVRWPGSSPSKNLLNACCYSGLVVLGFTLVTPELLFRAEPFFQGLVYEAVHYSRGHPPHQAFDQYDNNLFYWSIYLSQLGLGLAASVLGLVYVVDALVYRRSSQRMLLCSYLIIAGLLILLTRVRFERNLENFLAPLTIAAAATAVDLLRATRKRTNAYIGGLCTALLLAALLFQPIRALLRFREATRPAQSLFDKVDFADSKVHWLGVPYPGTPEELASESRIIFVDYGDKFGAANFAVFRSILQNHEIDYVRSRWADYGYPFSTITIYHDPAQLIVVRRKPARPKAGPPAPGEGRTPPSDSEPATRP